jgi:hypothetical protein
MARRRVGSAGGGVPVTMKWQQRRRAGPQHTPPPSETNAFHPLRYLLSAHAGPVKPRPSLTADRLPPKACGASCPSFPWRKRPRQTIASCRFQLQFLMPRQSASRGARPRSPTSQQQRWVQPALHAYAALCAHGFCVLHLLDIMVCAVAGRGGHHPHHSWAALHAEDAAGPQRRCVQPGRSSHLSDRAPTF